jgi:peptidoglycan hydrolase-like protein with peptidoglycan-binding domain
VPVDKTNSDDASEPEIRQTSDGAVSGSHPELEALTVPAASAKQTESNKIVAPLRPVGCWSMGDTRFAFNSSFLAPSAAEEFPLLARVREENGQIIRGKKTYPPLSIFGHADPVGNDDYNKQLSGRRALAVYAALVRDTAKWEALYSNPMSADTWGEQAVQAMLGELGYSSADSIRSFQTAEGLTADGQAGPQTRKRLFERYMDRLCGSNLKLSKSDDFLGRGVDPHGKADYQGCSEFNPVLMFSATENQALNQPAQKEERDAQNSPNRRVLILLFPPGEKVDPAKWPCPAASEGTSGCHTRFWSDAQERRSFQAQRRLYEITHDTFACRFYDRLTHRSPCERALAVLRVRLHDSLGRKMPRAPYQVEYNGRTKSGHADREGFTTDVLDPTAETCTVRWEQAEDGAGPSNQAGSSSGAFLNEVNVFVKLLDLQTEEGLKRRLHNLGYPFDGDLELNLRAFQSHHELDITGEADDATKQKLSAIYSNSLDQTIDPEQPPTPSAPDSEQRT